MRGGRWRKYWAYIHKEEKKDTHAGWAWNERINHVCVVYEMILETIAQFIFLLFLLLSFFLGRPAMSYCIYTTLCPVHNVWGKEGGWYEKHICMIYVILYVKIKLFVFLPSFFSFFAISSSNWPNRKSS